MCKVRDEIIKICVIMGEPHVDLNLLEEHCAKLCVNIKNRDGTYRHLHDILMDLSNVAYEKLESSSNPDGFSLDIPALKKKIKYCKNLLEKKWLEKQLNVAYKELRKGR